MGTDIETVKGASELLTWICDVPHPKRCKLLRRDNTLWLIVAGGDEPVTIQELRNGKLVGDPTELTFDST